MKHKLFQIISAQARLVIFLVTISVGFSGESASAATGTVVPVSAGLATGIAADLFPVTVRLSEGALFLTSPRALFLENERVGMQVDFQAYDHRPAQGIAISETGNATVSGILGYDAGTQQVLLSDPRIEKLEFDQQNGATQRFLSDIKTVWSTNVSNPLRARLPPHPYLIPFRNNIQNIAYDGKAILLTLSYE